MFVHIVRFASDLSDERIRELFASRAPWYEEVWGLVQKYYLRFDSGHYGGVYVWDSPESLAAFRATELSRTICDVYEVTESTVDEAEVVLALRPVAR